MTPLELERWVLLASDGSHPQLQWQANAMLHRWLSAAHDSNNNNSTNNNTTTPEVVNVLLQVLAFTQHEPVLFYALTTLQRLDLTPEQRMQLRQLLLTTFSTSTTATSSSNYNNSTTATTTNNNNNNNNNGNHHHHPTRFASIYLRTKVGVVLAFLIQCDFPHYWPNAFFEFMQPSLLHSSPDIFLRTLDALMEDFGMNENDVNRHLKDVLRSSSTYNNNNSSKNTNDSSSSNTATINNSNNNPNLSSLAAQCLQTVLSILGQSYGVIVTPLSSTASSNGQQQQVLSKAIQLATLSLTVVRHFIAWVDLTIILDEELQVLSLIFALIKATSSTTSASSPSNGNNNNNNVNNNNSTAAVAVAVGAVACLHELVGRGMEGYKKIALLRDADLLQRIYLHVNLDTVDESPIEVVLEMAKLINLTGLEVLPIWEETTITTTTVTTASNSGGKDVNAMNNTNTAPCSNSERDATILVLTTLLQQLLDLFFRCFAYDDIDVSGAVIPLASRLATSLSKEDSSNATTNTTSNGSNNNKVRTLHQHLPQLFTIMYRQMKYPVDYQYDYEDEDEAEEEVYRTELRKLNQRLVRVAPEMALQFLCQILANLPVPISQSPTPDVEAALRLVYHYCEGIQPSPGLKVVMRLEIFRNVLVALHNSDISSHAHREVLTIYYETAVRYYPIFKDHPDLLLKVLEAMSGSRGIQHPHPRVRSRSCYLLLRLVKAVTGLMRPYVETAITGIQGLLSNPTVYDLRTEDTMYLFETIGLLLGKTQLGDVERQRYVGQVITPHIHAMDQALASSSASADPEQNSVILTSSIAAIANLSKGNSIKPTDATDVLQEAVRATLAALESLPQNDQIRSKAMILLQRMINCIGIKLLPSLPRFLSVLVENCNSEDVLDVAQLYNQLCIRFKHEAAPVLDEALLPFLAKCRSIMPSTAEVVVVTDNVGNNNNNINQQVIIPPHLRTEQLSIQKLAFIVLHHIVLHRVTAVLISPTNSSHLARILQTMSEGAVHVEDAGVKKTCLSFFRELLVQWLEADNSNHAITGNAAAGHVVLLVQFVGDMLVPSMFRCMLLDPTFKADDALQARNIAEFGLLLSVLRRDPTSHEIYSSSVSNTLRSLGCPQHLSDAFLRATTGEEIASQLRALIKAVKSND